VISFASLVSAASLDSKLRCARLAFRVALEAHEHVLRGQRHPTTSRRSLAVGESPIPGPLLVVHISIQTRSQGIRNEIVKTITPPKTNKTRGRSDATAIFDAALLMRRRWQHLAFHLCVNMDDAL
jgi:hypothetical protein